MDVFADWLDVTYSPDCSPWVDVSRFLQGAGAHIKRDDGKSLLLIVGDGVIKIDERSRFVRISCSGAALEYLRKQDCYQQFLAELSAAPHLVTRLDVALDTAEDGAATLERLRRRFPATCQLSRKALKTTAILSRRDDGRLSGSFYVGHRSRARVTLRVYDKALERYNVAGILMPPTTRYELTIRGDRDRPSASLRDAAEPASIFWHHLPQSVLAQRPARPPPWEPVLDMGWSGRQLEPLSPRQLLARRVESSPDLRAILDLAADCGPDGFQYLQKLLQGLYRANPSPPPCER